MLFAKRRQAAKTPAAAAILTNTPPQHPANGPQLGAAGWGPPMGALHPSQQIGTYAAPPQSQFPARVDGPQLHSGVEWLNSAYYYPTRTYLPNGSVQQTQQPANVSGGQRIGSRFTGTAGPVKVKAMRANVVSQQVRQSGMAALSWAAKLVEQ